jgi:hypothetical protein
MLHLYSTHYWKHRIWKNLSNCRKNSALRESLSDIIEPIQDVNLYHYKLKEERQTGEFLSRE